MSEARPPDHHDHMPEGEEQAPPGVRTMALVRWGLIALMALAAVGAWLHYASTSGIVSGADVTYICPMHPQIVMNHKGECPICGMDLVPAGQGGAAPAQAAGPVASGPSHDASGAPLYTCPMHPAFVTTDPAARCPECGMKLVARTSSVAPPAGAKGVPGLVPVELSADRTQLIGMKTATVTLEPLAPSIRAVGFVTANEAGIVSVNTRFSGWVETLNVAETGQLVRRGEILATVYSPEMINAQQVFLNAIKWSERRGPASGQAPQIANDLERDARLRLELQGVDDADIDEIAKAGVVAEAINVRSPVRGYVARRNVLKGLYVAPGSELFQIADLSTVWVLVDVYEAEIQRVKVGQKAVFEVGAYPGEKFVGKLTFIYPALNTASRTLQARVEFKNPSLKLRPGMFGDVTVELGPDQALTIPSGALVDTGETQYVFVDRGGGRFEPRRVQAGWSGGGKVAVLSGLAEGERVVTTANFLLDSESRLRAAVEAFGATGHEEAPPVEAAPAGHAGHGMAMPAPKAGAAEYTCPMHPAFVTTDPKARCPECGMKLVPRAGSPAKPMAMPGKSRPMPAKASTPPAKPMAMPGKPGAEPVHQGAAAPKTMPMAGHDHAGATPAAAEYTCPMHPAFVTTDPKARCPECGMTLVPRGSSPAAAMAMPGMEHAAPKPGGDMKGMDMKAGAAADMKPGAVETKPGAMDVKPGAPETKPGAMDMKAGAAGVTTGGGATGAAPAMEMGHDHAMPAEAPAAAPAATAEYTCPMHPAFVTTDPKARCPECGMKLVPRDAAAKR